MVCPKCGVDEQSNIVDGRPNEKYIRRRRICASCGYSFRTIEVAAVNARIVIEEVQPEKWSKPKKRSKRSK